MSNRVFGLLLLAILATSCAATPISTPSGRPAVALGRGVNIGNALEAPNEGEWGITLDEPLFDAVAEAGFATLRLPVNWAAHAQTTAPYTIDPAFFARIDWAIDQSTRRGLQIVVNVHHYDELMADPQGQRARFLAIWQQIAEHYHDRPASVVFELCNEPNGISAATWNELARAALATVRASNPTRAVVIGGVDWNGVSGLVQLDLPADDPNIIVTFHYYSPYHFTHQGAEWAEGSQAWLGTTWTATPTEMADVRRDFDTAAAWAKRANRPLWLGEFGAYSRADIDSRARWTAFIAREAEARGMAWAYWEFAAGFGIYDRKTRTWNTPLRSALLP